MGAVPLGSGAPSAVTKASVPRTELERAGQVWCAPAPCRSVVEGDLPAPETSLSHVRQLELVHRSAAWLCAGPWEGARASVLLPALHGPAKS